MESKPLLEKVEEGAHHHAPDKKSKPVFSKAVKKAANRIINYSPDDLPIDEDASPTAQGCYRLWKRLLVVETVLLLAYLLFPVLERPSWCYYSDCGNHTVVLQSNIWKMPARASQSVELGFVFFFFTMVALQCFAIGTDRFFKQMSSRIEFGVLCFLLVTVIIEMFANSRWLFWSPIIRPIYFVLKHRDARSVFFAIGKSIPAVLPILGILALQIFMFGWIGVLLFIGETDVSDFFGTLWAAWEQLYIGLTFSNSLAMFQPAFLQHRLSALYFVIYVIIAIYLLQSLVLAVVYNMYRLIEDGEEDAKNEKKKELLAEAFNELDEEGKGYLLCDTVKQLFDALNSSNALPPIEPAQYDMLWDVMDADNNEQVSKPEFLELFSVVKIRFHRIPVHKFFLEKYLHKHLYQHHWWQQFAHFVRSRYYEWLIDLLLLFTAIIMFVQTIYLVKGKSFKAVEDLQLAFTVIFTIDIVLKFLAHGPGGFWHSITCRFDLLVVVALIGATIFQHFDNIEGKKVLRYVLVIRLISAVRILSSFSPYRILFHTFERLARSLPKFFLAILVVYTMAGLIGERSIGGEIYIGNPKLNGTGFDELNLYAFSFNDFLSSQMSLFTFMVSGDWANMVYGYIAVSTRWQKLFFIAFYVLVNLICLNLVIGVIIDAFVEHWKKNQKGDSTNEELEKLMKKLKQPLDDKLEVKTIN